MSDAGSSSVELVDDASVDELAEKHCEDVTLVDDEGGPRVIEDAGHSAPAERYAKFGRVLVNVGSLIGGRDGITIDPDGREMRCVSAMPTTHVMSCTWTSRDGAVRQRYLDPISQRWAWGQLKPVGVDGMVFVGTTLSGGRGSRIPIARAIGLAWVSVPEHLARERIKCARVLDPSSGTTADNVGWFSRRDAARSYRLGRIAIDTSHEIAASSANDVADGDRHSAGGTRAGSAAHDVEPAARAEAWRPLKYVVCTPYTLCKRFDPRVHGQFFVSSDGRFRNHAGSIVTPRVSSEHEYVIDVRSFGTIPAADAVFQTFLHTAERPDRSSSGGAARASDWTTCGAPSFGNLSVAALHEVARVPPRVRPAERRAFEIVAQRGGTPRDVARILGIGINTAYCHLCRAATVIEIDEIPTQFWVACIPDYVRNALDTLMRKSDPVLSGPLVELRDVVSDYVKRFFSAEVRRRWYAMSNTQWQVLRVARVFIFRHFMHRSAGRPLGQAGAASAQAMEARAPRDTAPPKVCQRDGEGASHATADDETTIVVDMDGQSSDCTEGSRTTPRIPARTAHHAKRRDDGERRWRKLDHPLSHTAA